MARKHGSLYAALSLLAFAGRPVACLSDVTVPDCLKNGPCPHDGGSSSDAGAASQAETGGNAGATQTVPTMAGASGTTDGGASGVQNEGGNAGIAGGGAGGTGGGGVSGGGTSGNGGVSGGGTSGNGGVSGGACTVGCGGDCNSCNIVPSELTDPCGTNLYTAKLHISGGEAPFQWSLTASAGTWNVVPDSLDSSHANLVGTPTGATSLTVSVTDHAQRTFEKVYTTTPRPACYLAYVSPDASAVPKLTLIDPLLEVPAPITLSNNQGVFDFQFSPSGRFLVYRYQDIAANPVKSHLSLVDLSTWEEHPLTFGEDAVTAYAWSADSASLAVMFSAGQTNELGGVRLTVPSAPAGSVQLTTLAAVASSAPAESGLYWLGTAFVSFYATILPGTPNPLHRITAYSAQLNSAGFAAPLANDDDHYVAPVNLKPTGQGFFMIAATSSPGTGFHVVGPDGYSAEHGTDFVAPSGSFTASVDADLLKLFNAGDDDLNDGSIATAAGCGKILSWAVGKERIACLHDVSNTDAGTAGGEIRIFDLLSAVTNPSIVSSTVLGSCTEPGGDTPISNPCPTPEYYYDEASSLLQPRLLSPSGRWFAFMTNTQHALPGDAYISWADLNAHPITISHQDVAFSLSLSSASRNVISFSPSEEYLLLQTGSVLSLRLLSIPQNSTAYPPLTIDNNLLPPSAGTNCSEDFGAAPLDWCGAADRPSSFAWAPDSKRVAYQIPDKLTVIDHISSRPVTAHQFNMAPCSSAQCTGQFAFQPQP